MTAAKAKRTVLAVEIPRDELAMRMLIAAIGARPPSLIGSAAAALADADKLNPGIAANFRRCADAAVLYFHECVNAGRQPS